MGKQMCCQRRLLLAIKSKQLQFMQQKLLTPTIVTLLQKVWQAVSEVRVPPKEQKTLKVFIIPR